MPPPRSAQAWLGAGRATEEMLPRRNGAFWRAVLARPGALSLRAGFRPASGASAPHAGADELRGEPDRYGGVSVRLGALERLDAAAFRRRLHGKCAGAGAAGPRTSLRGPSPRGKGSGHS